MYHESRKTLTQIAEEKFPFRECSNCGRYLGNKRSCFICGSEETDPTFRQYQKEALVDALEALYVEGKDNVVLDLPTGVGKSAINVTIALVADEINDDESFYTTPQKALRDQIANDSDINEHIEMLKARGDYTCGASGESSDECPIKNDPDRSCSSTPDCTYWEQKKKTMNAKISSVTFAMLITDGYLQTYSENGDQISFDDRDLLIVDEGHSVETQVAEMYAGFTISERSLPDQVIAPFESDIRAVKQDSQYEVKTLADVRDLLDRIKSRCNEYIDVYGSATGYQNEIDSCESYIRKYDYSMKELKEIRPWVVGVEELDDGSLSMKIKPVEVDRYLRRKVWDRGEKIVLSTATVPFPNDISKWARRIGLDPEETAHVKKPMPFPAENRKVHTWPMISKMSNGGDDTNWSEIVQTIDDIWGRHIGEKGIVHTASYERAERLARDLGLYRVYLHEEDQDAGEAIQEWQTSERDLFISPAVTEGIDMIGDKARWQVLLKVPYKNAGDQRTRYLLNKWDEWEWYYNEAYVSVLQSVGRAVRSAEDEADYYVLDKSFEDVVSQVTPPMWFMESINSTDPVTE